MSIADAVRMVFAAVRDAEKIDIIERGGVGFSKAALSPIKLAGPKPIKVSTLKGVVDYLTEATGLAVNRDDLTPDSLVVNVESVERVLVMGPLDATNSRSIFLEASPPQSDAMAGFVGRYQAADIFVVKLLTMFRPNSDRERLLRVVGNLTKEAIKTSRDDGVTQTVVTKKGIVGVAEESISNPVMLKPLRSFAEIELDEVPFVLRVQPGADLPEVALFEADGGAWRVDAITKIGDHLRAVAPDSEWGLLA